MPKIIHVCGASLLLIANSEFSCRWPSLFQNIHDTRHHSSERKGFELVTVIKCLKTIAVSAGQGYVIKANQAYRDHHSFNRWSVLWKVHIICLWNTTTMWLILTAPPCYTVVPSSSRLNHSLPSDASSYWLWATTSQKDNDLIYSLGRNLQMGLSVLQDDGGIRLALRWGSPWRTPLHSSKSRRGECLPLHVAG